MIKENERNTNKEHTSRLSYICVIQLVEFDRLCINDITNAVSIYHQVNERLTEEVARINSLHHEDQCFTLKQRDKGFIVYGNETCSLNQLFLLVSDLMAHFFKEGLLLSGGITYGTLVENESHSCLASTSLVTLLSFLNQCQFHGLICDSLVKESFQTPTDIYKVQMQDEQAIIEYAVPTLGYRINRLMTSPCDTLAWPILLGKTKYLYSHFDVYEQYEPFVKVYGEFDALGSHAKESFKNMYVYLQTFCKKEEENEIIGSLCEANSDSNEKNENNEINEKNERHENNSLENVVVSDELI